MLYMHLLRNFYASAMHMLMTVDTQLIGEMSLCIHIHENGASVILCNGFILTCVWLSLWCSEQARRAYAYVVYPVVHSVVIWLISVSCTVLRGGAVIHCLVLWSFLHGESFRVWAIKMSRVVLY